MRWLASWNVRLFLVAWVLFCAHFATNVVREHYPALSLVDDGTFRVDAYEGFHSDIFRHRDGHSYIGNQVAASVVTALPLFLFKPLLGWLEDKGAARAKNAAEAADVGDYRTEYGNRQAFLRKVRERGLDLKLGATTAITSVFLMAPISAAMVVAFFALLTGRGVARGRAAWLAMLFGFATPVFYRTAHLNHNVMLMAVIFGGYLCLWPRTGTLPVSRRRRAWAGFLQGSALALDYAGVVPLLVFWVGMMVSRRQAGWKAAVLETVPYVLGSVPPVLFLMYSQWAMYGHPLLPGQFWMPAVNFTDRGWRGYSLPTPELIVRQFIDLNWGLLTFGPLLALGFLPAARRSGDTSIVPRRERWLAMAFVWTFILFCAGNQYSLMQWNSGFRYLLPVVPFVFLTACDRLARLPRPALIAISVVVFAHEWVLSMVRFTPVDFADLEVRNVMAESWRRFLEQGVQFPWLTVLRQTSARQDTVLSAAWLPYAVLAGVLLACLSIVLLGRRAERLAALRTQA